MNKNHYDYIICGGGASGLLLAFRMCNDPFFKDQSILLIEKESKNTNDKTWCFWESGESDLEPIVYKKWSKAYFGAHDFEMDFEMDPFQYKMIRSIDFYQYMKNQLASLNQLTQIKEKVCEISENEVTTDVQSYQGDKIFSSIFDPKTSTNNKNILSCYNTL